MVFGSKESIVLYITSDYDKNSKIIKQYQNVGLNVIAISNIYCNEMSLADEFLINSKFNYKKVVDFVKDKNVKLFLTLSDHFVHVVGKLNDYFNLSGVSYNSGITLCDKFLMHDFLDKSNLPSWPTILPKGTDDIENFKHKDVILKPTRSSGAFKSVEFEYEGFKKDNLLQSKKVLDQIFKINQYNPKDYDSHKKYGQILLQKNLKDNYRWILASGIVTNGNFERVLLGESYFLDFPNNIGLYKFVCKRHEYFENLNKEEKNKLWTLFDNIIEKSKIDNTFITIECAYLDGNFYPLDIALRFAVNITYFPLTFERMCELIFYKKSKISIEEVKNDTCTVSKRYITDLPSGIIKKIIIPQIKGVELHNKDCLNSGCRVPKIVKSGYHKPFLYIKADDNDQIEKKYHEWVNALYIEMEKNE